ncbi:MAG: class I SAM-dependent methyltransferase [Thermoanaerobaculia bacterium]
MTGPAQWNRDFYKTGYEGFERLENFPTPQSLQDYRQHLLDKTDAQATFIQKLLGGRKLRVIEFGSGNGRLLVALALRGALDQGVGVEISRSRVQFAESWAGDLVLANVRNVAADALTFDDFGDEEFDLAVCITGAFGYLHAIRETAPSEILKKMRRAVRPGGKVLFELYQIPALRRQMLLLNDGRLRLWNPLPEEDRFAYYLDDFEFWPEQNVLRHGKIFIGRDGSIDAGREEVLRYYEQRTFESMLGAQGFVDQDSRSDFQGGPYREGDSATLVVTASAPEVRR